MMSMSSRQAGGMSRHNDKEVGGSAGSSDRDDEVTAAEAEQHQPLAVHRLCLSPGALMTW